MERKFVILEDTNNKPGYHPQDVEIMQRGYAIKRVPLIVGDYCVETSRYRELHDNRRNERFLNCKFKGADPTKGVKMQKDDSVGTYTIAVDVKQGLHELEKNLLVGAKGNRYRFERELMRAWNLGIKVYFLIGERIDSVEQLSEMAGYMGRKDAGRLMLEKMDMLHNKFGCDFWFCDKARFAEHIINILSDERYLNEETKPFMKVV